MCSLNSIHSRHFVWESSEFRLIRTWRKFNILLPARLWLGKFSDDHELQSAYDVVYSFREDLMLNPRVTEFTEIGKLLCDETNKLGIDVPQSHSKNLVRKISSMFEELQFTSYQQNKVLLYIPARWKCVIQVAKLLNAQIKNHRTQMSWPRREEDLKVDKINLYITDLLTYFRPVIRAQILFSLLQMELSRLLRVFSYSQS